MTQAKIQPPTNTNGKKGKQTGKYINVSGVCFFLLFLLTSSVSVFCMKACGCDCHTMGKPAGQGFHVTALSMVPTAILMGVVGGQEG